MTSWSPLLVSNSSSSLHAIILASFKAALSYIGSSPFFLTLKALYFLFYLGLTLAMACKPLIPFALFFLLSFFTTATSSAYENKSIAEAPEASSISTISLLPSLSSFLPKRWRSFYSQWGASKGGRRAIAELKNTSASNGSTSTIGFAPAPAPAPISSLIEEDDEEKPLAVRWFTGISLGIGTGILTATIASFIYQAFHAYFHRPKPNRPVIFQRKIIDSQSLAFLNKDNSLEALESLGKGGSAEVFKASLENGRTVAIKKTFYSSHEGDAICDGKASDGKLTYNSAQIHSELSTLGQVRHRNLVTLLAFIPKPKYHLLIYDFMENGSLHDVLRKVEEGSYELTWPMRHKIAVDVAKGLKYLHFDCSPKIVHRDLKPSNILLDNEMEAHIGDFGIARVMPDKMTHLTSNNLAGTVGYIAPEFHQTLRYSIQGDVYAFGVLLVVLLTGREPSHDYFSDLTTSMGGWVNDVLASGEERAVDILDSQLRGHGLEAQMLLVFKIAAFCLNEAPNERPTSRDILQMLNQIQLPS